MHATNKTRIGAHLYDNDRWEMPSDRTFREAWMPSGPDSGVVVVDLERAKEIWREKIRAARVSKLLELDALFIRALEEGKSTSDIVSLKQYYRDAPKDPKIDAAKTVEELVACVPEGLKLK